jgi:thiamine thiazole synthase
MSVAATFGQPRMGPTFGGMLLSGEKVAELIIEKLKGNESSKTSETAAISK